MTTPATSCGRSSTRLPSIAAIAALSIGSYETTRWPHPKWRRAHEVHCQLLIEPGDGSKVVTEVAIFEREALTDATLGLTLAESKTILAGMQEAMVAQQAAAYLATQQTCPLCGTSRRRKGQHQIVVRS